MNLNRRGFLAGAGALVVFAQLPAQAAASSDRTLNPFVSIDSDGTIAIGIPSSEMGQGIITALPQLVADELDVRFDQIRVIHAPEKPEFRAKLPLGRSQITGGSISVTVWHEPLRIAGATARRMLLAAASEKWGVPLEELKTEEGRVLHPSGKSAAYGDLAKRAARQKVKSKDVVVRKPGKIAGQSIPRNDLDAKVRGSAEFGIDVRLPGLRRACMKAPPVIGGSVHSVDDSAIRELRDVELHVFDDFVAVVADTWWRAKKVLSMVDIRWNDPEVFEDSAAYAEALCAAVAGEGAGAFKRGKARDHLSDGIEATYEVPFLDHAPLEPLNCTVWIDEAGCRIWTGTQAQTRTLEVARDRTRLPESRIEVNTPFLGGGFGRRGNTDYVDYAVRLGMKTEGPVQLVWSREECFAHGFFRPAAAVRFKGSVEGKTIKALYAHLASDNILERYVPGPLHLLKVVKTFPMEGLRKECPYTIPHVLEQVTRLDTTIPIGFWRSVGYSYTGFFLESFVDELAHAAGADPMAFRLGMLGDAPRFHNVLSVLQARSSWGKPAEGRFQGVAIMESYGSVCGQVAEISVEDGKPRVHRVTAVVDCGEVVNPDIVTAQIMGGVVFGLSAAMGERIDVADGRVAQSNFHDYPLLRMKDAPVVEVHTTTVESSEIGGIGEVGVPPLAAAVCNAWFQATGQRIRSLPILQALQEAP